MASTLSETMDMSLYSIKESMDFSEINAVLQSAADVLDRATQRMALAAGEEGPVLDKEFPLVVKNTFFDLEEPLPETAEPKSQSCPIAAFNCPVAESSTLERALAGEADLMHCDLASAARLFSSGEVSRSALEETGHLAAPRTRPPPPAPLMDPLLLESSMPSAPTWSPQGAVPSAPTWSPKVSIAPAAVPQAPSFQPQYQPIPATSSSWYRVAYAGGVHLRSGPSVNASLVGITLPRNEFFAVAEELASADGRIYLRLADGRGWAFDDSALMPYNPTVVRGRWVPSSPESSIAGPCPSTSSPSTCHSVSSPSTSPSVSSPSTDAPWQPMEEPDDSGVLEETGSTSEATTKRRRRKRGGVKRNKAKRRLAEALEQQMKQEMEEAETDVPSSSEDAGSDIDATLGAMLPTKVA